VSKVVYDTEPPFLTGLVTCQLSAERVTAIDELLKTVAIDAEFPWHPPERAVELDKIRFDEITNQPELPEAAEYTFARFGGLDRIPFMYDVDPRWMEPPKINRAAALLRGHGWTIGHPRELMALAQAWSALPKGWRGVWILEPPLRVHDVTHQREFVPLIAELSDLPEWPTLHFAANPDWRMMPFFPVLVRRSSPASAP
jgi:hypothetical protein